MNSKGQLSIEFLLLLVAVLAFLSVFTSAFSDLEQSSLFAIDVQNAKRFVNELNNSAKTLSLLGEGSEKYFSYKIITEWELSNSPAVLTIYSESGKNISLQISESIFLKSSKKFKNKLNLVLRKENGKLILD
tara:strand:+ start:9429 stop:9824 length:396 start_codon:yes stop_codon:yes gene_type:complete